MVLGGVFYGVLLLMYIIWDKCIYVGESLEGQFSYIQSLLGIMMDKYYGLYIQYVL